MDNLVHQEELDRLVPLALQAEPELLELLVLLEELEPVEPQEELVPPD